MLYARHQRNLLKNKVRMKKIKLVLTVNERIKRDDFTHIFQLKILQMSRDMTNKQNECAPSEDSDQPGHPIVWSESSLCAQWVAKDARFLHADSEDWSDWADAQADLSLRWAHMPFCWFCHVAAQITMSILIQLTNNSCMCVEIIRVLRCHYFSLLISISWNFSDKYNTFWGSVANPK